MTSRMTLIGVTLLAGTGLVLATAGSQATQAPATPGQIAPAQAAPAVPANPEEAALRALHADFVKAYNAADSKALSDLLTDDAEVIDSSGDATRGRVEVASMYADSFQGAKGLKLESSIESIRFITPDVARVEGKSELSGGSTGDLVQASTYAILMVRRDGRWRLAEIRDYPVPAEKLAAYDHLKELEWMVGDWVDESGNVKVQSSVRWAVRESFLIRTYSVEVNGQPSMDGTAFIGWDPQTGQIKTWVFDSEGGHGEGLWTRVADDRWVVKVNGVTIDGRPNSGTQITILVGKDSVKVSSIDRIIGGEVAPDVLDVMMVRRPPAPEASAAKPAVTPSQTAPATGLPK